MIRQRIRDSRTSWRVYVYYVVTKPNAEEIMLKLEQIGCKGYNLGTAYDNLTSGKLDTGLTFSNPKRRESVVVIAKTSTALEFLQSLTHEFGHLANHIAEALGIPLGGEDVRYICDALIERTWPISRELLCDSCRDIH